MALTNVHQLVLYALGQFYQVLNQPLSTKPLQVRTSKAVFIRLLLDSKLISKQSRAVYKNLETLETKKLIGYHHQMISFTERGQRELKKIQKMITPFVDVGQYFKTIRPKRLQTQLK